MERKGMGRNKIMNYTHNVIEVAKLTLGVRARKDYGDITELSESIKDQGLLQPIVIDIEGNILDGGRRYMAHLLLDKETIPYILIDQKSPIEKKQIELIANTKRKQFTWDEEAELKEEIDTDMRKADPHWNIKKTSQLFHESEANTSKDIQLAKAMIKNPELKKCKDKNTARTSARRIREKMEREIVVGNREINISGLHKGDALEVLKTIPNESVDLVLFDPPFGVDLHKKTGWPEKYGDVYGKYEDTFANYVILMNEICSEIERVLKYRGHCYIFFALKTDTFDEIVKIVDEYLMVDSTLLFWIKPSNNNPVPYNRFAINYEPILFCSKGKPREFNIAHNATFHHDVDKSDGKMHPAQKPLSLYKELISISSNKGEIVLDPMAGSGSSIVSALSLNREIIGIEQDEEYFKLIQYRISQMKGK